MAEIRFGIDVARYQKVINFDKLKAAGVEFVMIKGGCGNDEVKQDDSMFERNVSECERVGIDWGFYLYSYATNLDEAESEVKHILRLLEGKKPTYPVCIDMEDADGYKARHNVTDEMCVQVCDYVCSHLEQAGYYAAIYANKDWLENHIKDARLDRYDKWLAQWNKEPTYKGQFGIWQNADDGHVDGIDPKINVDTDRTTGYRDYPATVKELGLNGWPKVDDKVVAPVIQKDSIVCVRDGARDYDGRGLISQVYHNTYTVLYEPKGDRVVIGRNGAVTAAMNIADLYLA
jgi:GH25 family lysozyme M1 (1,4-beta-N-acetylmuramidase)